MFTFLFALYDVIRSIVEITRWFSKNEDYISKSLRYEICN